MSFRWVGRTDDDYAWTWDATKIQADGFGPVYKPFAIGCIEVESVAVTAGETFSKGDLLYLDSNETFAVRSAVAAATTFYGVALHDVSALDFETEAQVARLTTTALFFTTDVNSVTPTSSHVGNEAIVDLTSGAWTLDITGEDDLYVHDVDTNRGVYIVRFLAAAIQDDP